MTLRGIVRVWVAASVVLLAALLGISLAAVSTTEQAARAETRRSQSLRLADELRQTSDDLTRMARSYAATGEPRFRDYFDEILAIRAGKAPRPAGYDNIYWDVVTSTGRKPRPSGPPVAFEVLAARAGFSAEELALLADARGRSDALAVFEKEAFAAVESDTFGSSAGGHEQAHGLLWGQGYHDAKARIMEPIGQVFALVDARTRQETAEARARADRYSEAAVALVFLMLGGILVAAVGARRAVLRPVAALDVATKRIAAGDLEVQAPVGGVTEIASLAVRFNDMTRSLRQEATTTARRTSELQARTSDLQRFRTAMDSTGDAIFLVDRDSMRFVEVNATAVDMLGYSRDELLELGPFDLQPEPYENLDCLSAAAGHGTTRSTGRVRRKDGSLLAVEALRHVQRSGEDWITVAVLRDITERNEADDRLNYLAHFDALTGLPNRTQFYDTLRRTLLLVSPQEHTTAVLFIDLDHFKNVNDTLGHGIGDELLIQVSRRILGCLGAGDTLGRLGGDEFAVLLTMEDGAHHAAATAVRIQDVLREPFGLHGHEITVTASIGITIHPDDSSDSETLIKYADTAMYQAKQAGRDAFRFFTTQMNTDALARLELEVALRKAVKNNEFVLHYQPQVRLDNGAVAGLEALLRWERPGHGLVAPSTFIPALEESGLIVDVGNWVIDTVCEQISLWRRSAIGPIQISVNVAARQVIEGDLEGVVQKALDDHEIPAHLLELELTESTLMADTDRTTALLESLRARGVGISIDDFGTGYSSLAYLRRFPIDKLKIDISFIREITTNADDAAISLAIIHMAHSLSLDVIAEGVETSAQLSYLRRHGCDQMQGYYFSPPLPVGAVEETLRSGICLPVPHDDTTPPPATLLLVDDDPHVLNALQMLLADDGYLIHTAATANEGFEVLALHQVHVLLCDERLPGMSGTDFLAQVKDMHPDTLRIVLSGCADDAALIGSINRSEVYRYYTKPWDAAELRDNIGEAFRHQRNLQHTRTGSHSANSTDDTTPGISDGRGAGQAQDEASATGPSPRPSEGSCASGRPQSGADLQLTRPATGRHRD